MVLEGIEFRFVFDRSETPQRRPLRQPLPPGVVVARDAPLYVANCRFFVRSPGQRTAIACINAAGSPICEVRNCLFLGVGGSGVRWYCPGSGRLTIHNSVCSGLTAVSANSTVKDAGSIWLTRNTFCGMAAVLVTCPVEAVSKVLQVTATENLFDVKSVLVHPDYITEKLPDLVGWRDQRNLFTVAASFTESRPPDLPAAAVDSLEAWQRLWGQSETGSRQTDTLLSPSWVQKARNVPDQLLPEDFRLEHERAGADVDSVGPGAAYQRWRRTSEYQQWVTRTERAR